MTKRAFTDKRNLLTNKNLSINSKKRFIRCYAWSYCTDASREHEENRGTAGSFGNEVLEKAVAGIMDKKNKQGQRARSGWRTTSSMEHSKKTIVICWTHG